MFTGELEFTELVHVCCVELKKAFSCVILDILWEVFQVYEIPGYLSLHTNQTQDLTHYYQ